MVVTNYSTEAEYYVLIDTTIKLIWLCSLNSQ